MLLLQYSIGETQIYERYLELILKSFFDLIIKFIGMNQFSERTKRQNLLRTKTKSFKTNYKQSQARVRSSSSMNNLAGKLYSQNINKDFSPNKTSKNNSTFMRSGSSSKVENMESSYNPQLNKNRMGGLQMRASHVPCFAELNTDLLKQKKLLQSLISSLKQGIAQEKRTLHKADFHSKKNQSNFNKFTDMYNEAHRRSLRLEQDINSTNHDNYRLKNDIRNLRQNIKDRNDKILVQQSTCERLENETKILRLSCMQQDKEKNTLKGQLAKQQRVMNSYSVNCKQLQNERAMLLIEINQSVSNFKL